MNNIINLVNTSKKVVTLRLELVDIAEDLNAGLLLSQILYWNLPDQNGNSTKLRVRKDGHFWLAKSRTDWWEECRLTEYQYDRAIKKLKDKDLVELHIYKFDGAPTTHIRLKNEVLNRHLQELGISNDETSNSDIPEEGSQEESDIQIVNNQTSLTETTTKNTTDNTSSSNDGEYVCDSNNNTSYNGEGLSVETVEIPDSWHYRAAREMLDAFREYGQNTQERRDGEDRTILEWGQQIERTANRFEGPYDEMEIKLTLSWLIHDDKFWIARCKVFNGPKDLLRTKQGEDETFFEIMYRRYKVFEKARKESPY
jgi:hypothetical protein